MLELKLTKASSFDRPGNENARDLIYSVDDGNVHEVKITSNNLEVQMDKKDSRDIANLRNVKLIYKASGGGCVILMGNLGCSFKQPFGGEFYVNKAIYD